MGQRLQLQTLLEEILGSDAVYFQPPESFRMKYPCIVYNRDTGDTQFADNKPYIFEIRYQVSLISRDPDMDDILKKLASLEKCTYDRHYTVNGLNHDVFNLFY